MRYVMKQEWLSFAPSFNISNETDKELYKVKGEFFTIGAHLSFQDTSGNELMYIKQRVLELGHTYELYRNGQKCAEVRKELFTFFNCRFTVDVPGPDDLEASGDLLDHEYSIVRGETPIAQVSKQWFTWTDTYGIEIADGADDVMILACAVIIDMACHNQH